jgi:hypothetical protein
MSLNQVSEMSLHAKALVVLVSNEDEKDLLSPYLLTPATWTEIHFVVQAESKQIRIRDKMGR